MKKTVLLLLILLGGALIYGIWSWQKNSYSTDSLRLEIVAPAEAEVGEDIVFAVRFKNNGDVRLEDPILILELPHGSVLIDGTRARITRQLEAIPPGREETMQFNVRLFGKEQELKEARAQLRYRPAGLSATYESETTATVLLSSVPLNLDFDLPSRVESSQKFDFRLNYFSRSNIALTDLRLIVEYPAGFSTFDMRPPSLGLGEWNIGVLSPAEGGRITGEGILRGEVGVSGVFRAKLGMWTGGEFILLKEVVKTIEIVRPRLHISQAINGQVRDVVAQGELLHYEVFFRNVADKPLEDLFLVVNLEGDAFDRDSVNILGGTYSPGTLSLAWEAKDHSFLRKLFPGEQGKVEFWVRSKEDLGQNQTLRTRVLLSDVRGDFTVKVQSVPEVSQTVSFEDKTFENTGSLPLRVGEETTMTIFWRAVAGANILEETRVMAVLPENVELTGKASPLGASLTFDPSSREAVWSIGTMTSREERSLAFQVTFSPTPSQRGRGVELIESLTLTSEDSFTGQRASAQGSTVSTSMLGEDGIVK